MEEGNKIPKNLITIWIWPEMPEKIKECAKTHKLEWFNHIHITNDNYYHCKYVDECMDAWMPWKACDYLRMYYLYQHGWVYIDMDCTILKSFSDVLDNEMFVCEEENKFIANGIVGAVKNHPMLAHYLHEVETNYIGSWSQIFQPWMYFWTELVKYSQWTPNITIYPTDWFLPYNHQTGLTNITENSHTNHFYLKSWIPKS